jgi:hypothetical protein
MLRKWVIFVNLDLIIRSPGEQHSIKTNLNQFKLSQPNLNLMLENPAIAYAFPEDSVQAIERILEKTSRKNSSGARGLNPLLGKNEYR